MKSPTPSPFGLDLIKPVPLGRLIMLARLSPIDWRGNMEAPVTGIATSSNEIRRNQVFVAMPGTRVDGHAFIADAVDKGAAAVVVQKSVIVAPGVAVIRVADTRRALGQLAQALYGFPAGRMRMVGVTGTNGKTTTTTLVRQILERAGLRTGTIGTLGASWPGGDSIDTAMTTPDALTLARLLARMLADGVQAVAMEASSHAIDQERIAGLPFNVGVLTNVSQDHLDYHGDYPTYIGVKRRLFFDFVAPTDGGVSVLNFDDPVGEELSSSYPGERLRYSATGKAGCDITATNVRHRDNGTDFTLNMNGRALPIATRLIGAFNVANMLAAAGSAHVLGVDTETIAAALCHAVAPAGRFERIDAGQSFQVVVDYSHTPDALEKALRTARSLTMGQLIVVFGCGGDRDRAKRPMMGEVAGELADYSIVTTDNPRGEDPERIARSVVDGVMKSGARPSRYTTILDRAAAIERAVAVAKPGDFVLIAGKGHETYQEVNGERRHFDDREVARAALQSINATSLQSPQVGDPAAHSGPAPGVFA